MFERAKFDKDEIKLPETPEFQNVYFHFDQLGLLNRDNLKTLCALSASTLTKLLSIINEPDEPLTSAQMEYFKTFFSLFSFATIKKINQQMPILKSDFLALLAFSTTKLTAVVKLLDNLFINKLLTQETYKQVVGRISAKIPVVQLSAVNKKSRKIKENDLSHSYFTLTNSIGFFIEHDERHAYPTGSIGKIKKGYVSAPEGDNSLPTYSVKIYAEHPETEEYVIKNAKCQALLGRGSWFFTRESIYTVVSQWQEGKPLHEFKNTELAALPFIMRFASLVNALSQLETLHVNLRTHNDLTPGNFIANFHEQKMALIDFDKVTKSVDADFQDDIEALSGIIKRIFPEINFHENPHEGMKPHEYAISLLVLALTVENPRQRCTINSALNFCQNILQEYTKLDNELCRVLANKTIFREAISLEDLLRGKTMCYFGTP